MAKEFASQLISGFFRFNNVFVGVIKFGNQVNSVTPLQPASAINYDQINQLPYAEGASNGAVLLNALARADTWNSPSAQGPREVTRSVVIVTDGMWISQNQAVAAAKALREQGINIYVIAVGQAPTRHFLKSIATDSVSYYTEVDSYNALTQIKHLYFEKACADMSCPLPCRNGGQCVSGQCQCKALFTGPDCSQTSTFFVYLV